MGINRSKIAKQLMASGGRVEFADGGYSVQDDLTDYATNVGREASPGGGFEGDSNNVTKTKLAKEIAKGIGKGAVDVALQTAFPPYGAFRKAQLGIGLLNRLGLIDPNAKFKGPTPTTEDDTTPVMPLVSPAVGIASQMEEQPSELAQYIASLREAQPSPFMLDPRFAAAEGGEVRQKYGLGSLVKKITRPIKKLVKSDVGKAALLAAGAYGLTRPGMMSSLGGLKDYIVGKQAMDYGEVASKGLLNKLRLTKTPGKFDLTTLGKIAGIGIPSLLGYMATPDEEDEETLEQAIARTYGTDRGIDIPGIRKAALGYSDPNELYFQLPQAFRLSAAEGGLTTVERAKQLFEQRQKDLPEPETPPIKLPSKEEKELFKMLEKRDRPLAEYRDGVKYTDAEGKEMTSAEFQEAMRKITEAEKNFVMPKGKPKEEILKIQIERLQSMKDKMDPDSYEMLMKEIMRDSKAEGGLMDLGGKEMDLRDGGFVPIGKKEKADDVPARLSKNEFVFTADAVRAAGGGSVDKGAQKMYNTMKQLENKI